jgi:hypothetical protein
MSFTRNHLLTAALAILATAGCSASAVLDPDAKLALGVGEEADGSFTTDSLTYHAREVEELWPGVKVYGFRVVTRYTNPTSAPIYLWTCYPDSPRPMYSVVGAGQATSNGIAYNGAWACVGHDRPIRVDPGATRVDTIQVRGPNAFEGGTNRPIDDVLEGRFRIMFAAQSCRTEGDCRIGADALTRSNEFTVSLAK